MNRSKFFTLSVVSCQVLIGSTLPLKAYGRPPIAVSSVTSGVAADRSDQTALSPRPLAVDRVLIEPKTVTFTRGKKGQEYPDYKEAVIKYPQVTGLADQAVLQNVQTAISLKSVMGQSLAELRREFQESSWLSEIDYTVNYNQNALLDITFTISGVGAYPSAYAKQRLISLKTGKALKPLDVFKRFAFGAIAVMVDKAMQADMKQAIATGDQGGADIRERLNHQRFQIRNLNRFSVNDQGITFLYDFDFPHVIKALEPSGRYFFTYDQLKAYIKPDGALGVFLPPAAVRAN